MIAPHPDDEALTAGGALLAAVERGESVHVVVLTNGDFDCQHDGLVRQAESVAGLSRLGVREEQVHFLGYPDGYLARLGDEPLEPVRRLIKGSCTMGNTTYGERGEGGAEVHRTRFGASARYTADALVEDLRALLAEIEPETLIVTHPEDTHPDHAAAYAYVRRAVGPLRAAPRVLRAFVHNDDCWPLSDHPGPHCPARRLAPTRPMPALGGSLRGYVADVRWPVPRSCLSPELDENPKLAAIFSHHSQVRDDPRSYLLQFARRDEAFFSERLVRDHQGMWASGPDPHRSRGLELSFGAPGHRALSHETPLALTVTTPRPPESEPLRVSFLDGQRGRYELVVDGRAERVRLVRKPSGSRPEVPLQDWALPHDVWSQPMSEFQLDVARSATHHVLELSLSLDGEFIGQAIDVEPLEHGASLGVESDPPGRDEVTLELFE